MTNSDTGKPLGEPPGEMLGEMLGEDPPPVEGIIAVFDLEWTAWEGSQARRWQGPGEEREVVQIGAVKLDAGRGLAETASFEVLAKPRINRLLSDYFTKLTGITRQAVDELGLAFPNALNDFHRFIGVDTGAIFSFGLDRGVLAHNCRLNDIAFPFAPDIFHNAVPSVARALGLEPEPLISSDLPGLVGFPPPGAAHQALGDARCIAEAFRILRREKRL
jgi:inhibitor of KinA sporulation pathway (predicted exonuclease)